MGKRKVLRAAWVKPCGAGGGVFLASRKTLVLLGEHSSVRASEPALLVEQAQENLVGDPETGGIMLAGPKQLVDWKGRATNRGEGPTT